jgi:hypothetical protein
MNSIPLSKIEHYYLGSEDLPDSLQGVFPKGVTVVMVDEELSDAVPSTPEEYDDIHALLGNPTGHNELCEKLCAPRSRQLCMNIFRTEMEKVRAREEQASLN